MNFPVPFLYTGKQQDDDQQIDMCTLIPEDQNKTGRMMSIDFSACIHKAL